MSVLLQLLTAGVAIGMVLGLLGLGWVVVYRVSGLLNLAQGSFLVVGALTASALAAAGWPHAAAVGAGLLASVAAGLLLAGVLRLSRGGHHTAPVIITLGAAEVFAEICRQVFGNDPLLLPAFLPRAPVQLGPVTVAPHVALLVFATLALLGLLWWVFERTSLGKELQACADSAEGAALVGINPGLIRALAFALAAGLAGAGGILLAPVTPVGWDSGLSLAVKGFVAAVLGRWRYPGTIIAGLFLGVTESLAAGYLASAWKDVLVLGVLLVVLLWRTAPWSGAIRRTMRRRQAARRRADGTGPGSRHLLTQNPPTVDIPEPTTHPRQE